MAQLISTFIFLLFSISASAEVLEVDPARSPVEFLAVGKPSMIKIRGKDAKASGTLDFSKKENLGEIRVDLNEFDTGIALRNQHMKEKYLQTNDPAKKFAVLTITKFELPAETLKNGGKKSGIPFEGSLLLNGEKQPVSSKADVAVAGKEFEGASKFQIKLTDHKIEIPSYLGVKVAEMVDIEVTLRGKLAEQGKKP